MTPYDDELSIGAVTIVDARAAAVPSHFRTLAGALTEQRERSEQLWQLLLVVKPPNPYVTRHYYRPMDHCACFWPELL
jgi:hypothetical protein